MGVTLDYRSQTTEAESVRRLRPGIAHLALWLGLGAVVMAMAFTACWTYNHSDGRAGTTRAIPPGQIARTTLGVHLGPFAGYAYRADYWDTYARLARVPAPLLVAGWLPFLLTRRPVRPRTWVAAWLLNVVAALVWYGSAVLSLAFRMGP